MNVTVWKDLERNMDQWQRRQSWGPQPQPKVDDLLLCFDHGLQIS